MSTKKLQLIDSLVKQADNADKLDGKHANEFAELDENGKIPATQLPSLDEVGAATKPTILFTSDTGNNTSEEIGLTTSDDLINYSRLEIIYGLSWNTTNIATIIPSLNNAVALSVTYAGTDFMSTTTGMCRLDLENKKLTRGTKIKDTGEDGINRERLIKTNYGTEKTINIESTLYTAANGFGIYIYRVIGYKD